METAIPSILLICGVSILILYIRKLKNELIALYNAEKTDFAQNLPTIGKLIGESLSMSVRNAFAGAASGPARLEKGLEGALTQDLLDQNNPLLAGILNAFPSVKKYILKNPAMVPQLLQLLGQLNAGRAEEQSQWGKKF